MDKRVADQSSLVIARATQLQVLYAKAENATHVPQEKRK